MSEDLTPAQIAMNKIRAQRAILAEKEAKKGGGAARMQFWRPDAKSTIRILPSWTTEGEFAGQFWKKVGQHWNVKDDQEGPVLCPKVSEGFSDTDRCPICEFVNTLRADKTNIKAQEMAKSIRAKEVYFLPIIDLKHPKLTADQVPEGSDLKVGAPRVQVYAAPGGVFNDILGVIDNNNCDITDHTSGRDIVIEKIEKAGKKQFTSYKVSAIFNATKAPVPEGFVTPSLLNVGWRMNYKELHTLLTEGEGGKFLALGSGSEEAETESGEDSSYLNEDNTAESASSLGDDMKKELEALGVKSA